MHSIDIDFQNHLLTLTNGKERLQALKDYKANSFELNKNLKAVFPDGGLALKLLEATRAKPKSQLTLYRMTSDVEFVVNCVKLLTDKTLSYAAFASATTSLEVAKSFVPPMGTPLLLTIDIPPKFPLALMEGNQLMGESERLIPCGTEFVVIDGPREIVEKIELEHLLGSSAQKQKSIFVMHLKASKENNYLSSIPDNEFFEFEDDFII